MAGPVVAAAVILSGKDIRGLADSKVLNTATRAKLATPILERCHVGIGVASVDEIVLVAKASAPRGHNGAVLLCMSNGSFGGLHDKLLAALKKDAS